MLLYDLLYDNVRKSWKTEILMATTISHHKDTYKKCIHSVEHGVEPDCLKR